MFADQDKRPMILALGGTIVALVVISLLWWHWHAPTEAQQVDSYKMNPQGELAPAQRSAPAVGNAQ